MRRGAGSHAARDSTAVQDRNLAVTGRRADDGIDFTRGGVAKLGAERRCPGHRVEHEQKHSNQN